ncbi:hypothetical protein LABALGLTS371_15800 [Dellaglioa algida]|uniref:DNA primase/polymerase bifunctional N-terminal domain-containing protein n=1 Tax=Dellaglioa algida TaxID=105612 RepID=A0A5C6MBF3_9LACO|nr:bifunctional DNA primase/polymerase [Dellaglioa algida]MDK1716387.1 bifunctional DNA primase/polymerase [Dellaglioa algida]MDK1721328.1 bifunctional DNA primase/polymerase [Dellaglioa algida]TWW10171.1 hypothetical protein LABALGLTS371_15800 [Dellaglioa algida]
MRKIDALDALRKGYRITPVINKKPFLPFKTLEVDKHWVLRNWKNEYDVAVVCRGVDWFVVDFDNEEVFKKLELLVANGFVEQTKRGYHVYFSQPRESPLIQVIGIVNNVDIKASGNNYVVTHGPLPELDDLPEPSDELLDFITNTIPEKTTRKLTIKEIENIESDTFISQPLFDVIENGWGEPGTHDDTITNFIWMMFMLGASTSAIKYLTLLADSATKTSTYTQDELFEKIRKAHMKWSCKQ